MVQCLERPPDGVEIALRLDGEILPQWYQASVREAIAVPGGGFLLRLSFEGGCPYELYMAAAFGISRVAGTSKAGPAQQEPKVTNQAPHARSRRGGYWHA
jgi:hypothetical protein